MANITSMKEFTTEKISSQYAHVLHITKGDEFTNGRKHIKPWASNRSTQNQHFNKWF